MWVNGKRTIDVNTLGITGRDRVALHTCSNSSAWKLFIGPFPFGRNGGRSKKVLKINGVEQGRAICGSMKKSKGAVKLIHFTVEVLSKIATTGDGPAFAYAIEVKQALHDILQRNQGDKDGLANDIDTYFDDYGRKFATEHRTSFERDGKLAQTLTAPKPAPTTPKKEEAEEEKTWTVTPTIKCPGCGDTIRLALCSPTQTHGA